MNIYFLHGFLGLPSDWVPVLNELHQNEDFDAQVHLLNLWNMMDEYPIETMLTDWASEFSKDLQGKDNWLIGYSMGGRLLLNVPESSWDKIAGMVLISSHPGLANETEKQDRLKQDQNWSKVFLEKDWSELMNSWNGQPVFVEDGKRPERYEEDYKRDRLSKAMDGWSLGRQHNFLPEISKYPFPVFYLYGDKDKKYAELAKKLGTESGQQVIELPSGHNPLISCPKNLSRVLHLITSSQAVIN